jgi:hypothetical protein
MFGNGAVRSKRALVVFLAVLGWFVFASSAANAVPSMARQTGYSCARCHTVFPELTPFGREFKLGAFAMSSEEWDNSPFWKRVPVAALAQVARTQTRTALPEASEEGAPRDRETILQAGGVYYGGKITDNSGALIQYNYNGIERKWGMEMFDARYGDQANLAGEELLWGVTMNNTPTVSDIYNSTRSWSFPHTDQASVMPAASTLLDMSLASQVGSVGFYSRWNDLLYAELDLYRTANTGFFRLMGLGDETENVVEGTAPYWRLALQHESAPHYFEVGTYGMVAKVRADRADAGLGTNRFRDVAVDGSYQYIKDDHTVSIHATWIRETQDWNASFPLGMSSSPSTVLKTFRGDMHYFYKREWGGGVQYFDTRGDANDLLYNTGDPVMGSTNGRPDSRGWTAELNYLPLENTKLALRYTSYQKFNGASDNYDGFGRSARDNDSIFALVWVLL